MGVTKLEQMLFEELQKAHAEIERLEKTILNIKNMDSDKAYKKGLDDGYELGFEHGVYANDSEVLYFAIKEMGDLIEQYKFVHRDTSTYVRYDDILIILEHMTEGRAN